MTPAAARNTAHLTPSMHMLCHQAPVIPVLTINDLAHAVPLAEALVAGGLPVLEVTLRTSVALQAISLMARVPGVTIGAGTALNPKNAREAHQAGATFAVSPGATHQLIDCCEDLGLPLLPGAASASEIMRLVDRGFDLMKFFPAAAAGGVAALRSFGAPLPQVHFCPTGGISQESARDYLALSNVACVGGSWVAPAKMVQEERWGEIRQLAHQARQLENGRQRANNFDTYGK
jgi:2-dehydro-3-deoxyphosphogluconate aldolase/(4S)-4-hydroxy-2-oxoglutarate aldolase